MFYFIVKGCLVQVRRSLGLQRPRRRRSCLLPHALPGFDVGGRAQPARTMAIAEVKAALPEGDSDTPTLENKLGEVGAGSLGDEVGIG